MQVEGGEKRARYEKVIGEAARPKKRESEREIKRWRRTVDRERERDRTENEDSWARALHLPACSGTRHNPLPLVDPHSVLALSLSFISSPLSFHPPSSSSTHLVTPYRENPWNRTQLYPSSPPRISFPLTRVPRPWAGTPARDSNRSRTSTGRTH